MTAGTAPSAGTAEHTRKPRPLGILAMCAAVLCFSISSTIIKKAELPGPTLAFWRMVVSTGVWWAIVWMTERKIPRAADLRRAAIPGIAFGVNITLFFTAITRTSIAHAEFIGSLTPLVVVPAGALFFHEKVNMRALSFGLVSLLGLTLVLFNGPENGDASWSGDLLVVATMLTWATYLLTSRRLRTTMSVQSTMAAMMPFSTLAILPIGLIRGGLGDVDGTQWLYVLTLALLTGTLAHGFITFAQHSVPVGTIGIIQVAQPALAVGWAYLLLDQDLVALQVVGMALVIAGLMAVVAMSRRDAATAASIDVPAIETG